jgi:hypothetical protein
VSVLVPREHIELGTVAGRNAVEVSGLHLAAIAFLAEGELRTIAAEAKPVGLPTNPHQNKKSS